MPAIEKACFAWRLFSCFSRAFSTRFHFDVILVVGCETILWKKPLWSISCTPGHVTTAREDEGSMQPVWSNLTRLFKLPEVYIFKSELLRCVYLLKVCVKLFRKLLTTISWRRKKEVYLSNFVILAFVFQNLKNSPYWIGKESGNILSSPTHLTAMWP